MFSGLLINVKRICAKIGSWLGNFSVYVPHGVMGSKTLLMLFFFRRKIDSLRERYASFKLATPEKMLLLTGKFRKACLYDEIPVIFFNLGAWGAAKTRVCLFVFPLGSLKQWG